VEVDGELATPASGSAGCALVLVMEGVQEEDVRIAERSLFNMLPGNFTLLSGGSNLA